MHGALINIYLYSSGKIMMFQFGTYVSIRCPCGCKSTTSQYILWTEGWLRIFAKLSVQWTNLGGRILTFVLWSYHLIGVRGVGGIWVSFKYKRIPNICYRCGCLNHFNKYCDLWIESEGSLTVEDQEYGPWIRASPVQRICSGIRRWGCRFLRGNSREIFSQSGKLKVRDSWRFIFQ